MIQLQWQVVVEEEEEEEEEEEGDGQVVEPCLQHIHHQLTLLAVLSLLHLSLPNLEEVEE